MKHTLQSLLEASDKHFYYCHTNNYYSNESACHYETYDDFVSEWTPEDYDYDYNMLFRWDIKRNFGDLIDSEEEIEELKDQGYGEYTLELFYMLQRKGIFRPVIIKNFQEKDVESLVNLLNEHWKYINNIWNPISGDLNND